MWPGFLMQTVTELAELAGIQAACHSLGVARASFYRHRTPASPHAVAGEAIDSGMFRLPCLKRIFGRDRRWQHMMAQYHYLRQNQRRCALFSFFGGRRSLGSRRLKCSGFGLQHLWFCFRLSEHGRGKPSAMSQQWLRTELYPHRPATF